MLSGKRSRINLDGIITDDHKQPPDFVVLARNRGITHTHNFFGARQGLTSGHSRSMPDLSRQVVKANS